jgi:hypothetical protein
VTDHLIASFRLYHLWSKCDPRDTATDILQKITVGALADDMTKAEVADVIFRGTQTYYIE